jgi:cytochrome d ubiquinol oxidase subunit II
VLLAGYAILDGFDLGAGMLHLFARGDEERRVVMNAIGPVWDGNEVWLITFGGALFAAFPHAYATVFSGFYIPFMLLLFALIFRAVSMEFRGKRASARWRAAWDACFAGGSLVATLLFGVAAGNMLRGIPVGADREFAGSMLDLLTPFPLLTGVFAVALFALHGALYLHLKTEGALRQRIRTLLRRVYAGFLVLLAAVTAAALATVPSALGNIAHAPAAWGAVVVNVLAVLNIPRAIRRGQPFYAFVCSACGIAATVFLFALALFPNLVPSSIDPAYSLTMYNAASSEKTLGIMRWIALIGMPFVLVYTAVIYRVFRGTVRIGRSSY